MKKVVNAMDIKKYIDEHSEIMPTLESTNNDVQEIKQLLLECLKSSSPNSGLFALCKTAEKICKYLEHPQEPKEKECYCGKVKHD